MIQADTFVQQSDGNKNYGTRSLLEIDGSPMQRTFIRILVSGVGSGQQVTSARLRLRVSEDDKSDSGGRIHHQPGCGWNETTLTWNNHNTFPFLAAVLDSKGPVDKNQVVEFDLNPVSLPVVTGNGPYCFVIDSLSSDGLGYNSREESSSKRPTCVIQVSAASTTTTTHTTTTSTTSTSSTSTSTTTSLLLTTTTTTTTTTTPTTTTPTTTTTTPTTTTPTTTTTTTTTTLFCPQFPATGQTTCWDSAGTVVPCAGTGQDGDVQAGATLAYTDNGDGTITDNNTGLMWEKKDNNDAGGVHDKDTTYDWADALGTFIPQLNNRCKNDETVDCTTNGDPDCTTGSGDECGFAGYRDWRLPNVKELESIVHFQNGVPAVASAFKTGCTGGCTVTTCSCTVPVFYWSSTTVSFSASFAWFVLFDSGTVGNADKTTSGTLLVRAVRGGS